MDEIEIRQYVDRFGRNRFEEWFRSLEAGTRARIGVSLLRLGRGNLSNAKGVGAGLFELRLDFGPGFRIYFGRDGDKLVILLAGGSKKRQQNDIEIAAELWKEYKSEKRKRNAAD
jgi:putative addiction module killer protein